MSAQRSVLLKIAQTAPAGHPRQPLWAPSGRVELDRVDDALRLTALSKLDRRSDRMARVRMDDPSARRPGEPMLRRAEPPARTTEEQAHALAQGGSFGMVGLTIGLPSHREYRRSRSPGSRRMRRRPRSRDQATADMAHAPEWFAAFRGSATSKRSSHCSRGQVRPSGEVQITARASGHGSHRTLRRRPLPRSRSSSRRLTTRSLLLTIPRVVEAAARCQAWPSAENSIPPAPVRSAPIATRPSGPAATSCSQPTPETSTTFSQWRPSSEVHRTGSTMANSAA